MMGTLCYRRRRCCPLRRPGYGDERMMLAKDPITSAVISVLLAGSCLLGRPAMFAISQRMHALGPDSAAR
ncbi:hypothetical protein IRT45_31620 [Nocardia sp. BSTN01]|uniref:hypothetical protein n=1 Tax=Nocardia sp. BSTN01 TaxID=2783665 RepID=UPI00188DF684|nr:hypothetical protein [Nocardia sp. BSTN01]MBF5001680.1 hypothetical protein [Nocardia sp. BSTN01]